MGNFTNKGLNYRPTWASIQNKPTTISGWLTDVYTKSEVDSIVDDAIDDLVNAAPGALDTLNELAAALGDDANFATTVTNSLAGKVSLSGSYSKPSWLTQVAASIVEQSANYRFVTDTEKTTWNAKQDALTNPVTGTGTNNYLTQWGGINSVSASAILNSSSSLYFPNNKGIYYRNAANTADLNAIRWYDDNNLSFGDSNVNIITTSSNFIGLGTGSIWSKITLGGETTLFNNISLNGVVQANNSYVSLIKLDTSNRVSIAAAGSDTIFGGKIKTVTPSANGAGNWKLGKQIGADGTGATRYIEVDIEGELIIFTAKVK